ncbi:MAG TPA: glycosyltransferase [Candidatus Kapabacteria bacterium]|nr:glycosyltransferase [Candidatus Kapabacteria bacterium]
MTLTVHCIVKNEERFVEYALRSVAPYADHIFVFDTGSTDQTVPIIRDLQKQFPQIMLEEKGESDKERHTALRQEMVERTTTEWFMIVDGDEIWTKRGMAEAIDRIEENASLECLIAPFYLCVGDIYHYSSRGMYKIRGQLLHATPRFFRKTAGLHWKGAYNTDMVVDAEETPVFEKSAVLFLQHSFWHVSHLIRSSRDDREYSSGSVRQWKRRLTYHWIGRPIPEQVPEVFLAIPSPATARLGRKESFVQLFRLVGLKVRQKLESKNKEV